MAAPLSKSAGASVVIHLLDSAQGNPLQTWRLANRDTITIGRDADCDIVLADPHVSRTHARLVYENGVWTLFSTGRHGTLVNDRMISDVVLQHQTVFRLGAGGPMLRFDAHAPELRRSETIENIEGDLFAALSVDESRKQREVDQIAGNELFRDLQEQSKRMRRGRSQPPNAH